MVKVSNKTIGLVGGTFDPAHKGHIAITKIAIKKLKLSKVLWIVTKKNPFKEKCFNSLNKRIALSKKLVLRNKFIEVIYIENKCKSNRTFKYIKYLCKKNQNTDFYFIMGADNLISFHKWRNWQAIPKICQILVFDRDNFKSECLKSIAYKKISKKRLKFIKFKKVNISSSQLRKI